MSHRYYSPLRPLSLGTFPKPQGNEILHIENFEERQNVPEIARQAWGYIEYKEALISLVFMLAIDVLIKINLIGFIPEQARTYLGLDTVGVAEFFALLYIAYEVVSIFKNMALCGLPVKKVWEKVREFLAKYTDELPDTDELDGDSTTGNVEEHRTQER